MSGEQQYNTEALQKRFLEVYRKFFAENDLVVSSDIGCSFTPGFVWRVGAPGIYHKLPFRFYLGIRKIDKQDIVEVGTALMYQSSTETFTNVDYDLLRWPQTLPYLEQLLKKKVGAHFSGIRLNFLIEISESQGFDAGVPMSIITGCYFYFDLLKQGVVERLSGVTADEIQKKSTELGRLFYSLHIEACKLLSFSVFGCVFGWVDYVAFLKSEYPFIYFTEERGGSVSKPFPDLAPVDVTDDVASMDNFFSWGFRANELVEKLSPEFPFDVVSIYTGRHRAYYAAAEYLTKVIVPSFEQLRDDTRALFSKVFIQDSKHVPPFLKNLDIDDYFWQQYGRGQVYSRVLLIREFLDVYKVKINTVAADTFLETLDSLINVSAPFEESPSENIEHVLRTIREHAVRLNIKIGIRNVSWGKQDANLLVLSQTPQFRDMIFECVDDLKQQYSDKIHIDFASWRDGWGSEGFRIEQFISRGIFSRFVTSNSWRLITYQKDGIREHIVKAQEFERGSFDLLLDKLSGKIYIGGEECNSKELPSQKAAIEILEFLLKQGGVSVRNKDLPVPTYTAYRNELQGKIITPLNQLLTARLKKRLGLKIHGRLMDFDVQFWPGRLTVGILERV